MAADAPTKEEKEFFKDMNPDEDIDAVTKIESLCVACGDNGMTRLLLTKIPFFREVIIMAFECDKCGFRSSEISPAGSLADKAVRFELRVTGKDHPESWSQEAFHADMNRQLVKSDSAVVRVPELEFEIPRNKRGEINTVEGILTVAADTLEMDQETRKAENEAVYARVQEIVNRLRRLVDGQESFTVVLEDVAGNSFLENPCAPEPDPRVKLTTWYRTNAELEELGYMVDETKNEAQDPNAFPSANPGKKDNYKIGGRIGHAKGVDVDRAIAPKLDSYFDVDERAAFLPGECPSCHQNAETRMCVTDLPYFKEVVIMATQCDNCGYRTTDIKPGGEVSSKGRKLTLRVTSPDDFKRDVMKSDTASLEIPELELHLGEGTLGGKYTTLEGLLENIKTEMQKLQAFKVGDSATPEKRATVEEFFKTLDEIVSGSRPFTFVLDDPLANSFIYSELPEGQDPALTTEDYERSFEQNEDLGLNDINVDHYLTPEQEAEAQAEQNKAK